MVSSFTLDLTVIIKGKTLGSMTYAHIYEKLASMTS